MKAFGRAWMVAVSLGPALALAQGIEVEIDERTQPVEVTVETRPERRWSVSGQAGILAFAGEAARLTTPGPLYGVAVGVEFTPGVNLEFGYQGSTYNTEAGPAGGDSGIVQNGGQAMLNLGPEIEDFFPFAQFGIQVSRLNVLRNVQEVRDATVAWLPMGVGMMYTIPSDNPADINVGARGTYNFTLDSGAFPTVSEPGAANQFTASALVGGRF
jgi:hypothetical protein